jgi:hypothetical protein
MKTTRRLTALLACLALLGWALSARACPFCMDERGPTLVGDFDQALLVIFGHFGKAHEDGFERSSDFVIEQVLKSHDIIKGKSTIRVPKAVDRAGSKFLLFCDVYKDRIDPYRGLEVQTSSELLKYLNGAMTVKTKSAPERLRYCFDFLNSPEIEVSLDAYREYARADYKDYKDISKTLPADTIAGWLQDDKTPPYRYGLYASLLGHCGGVKHAALLRSMIDDPEKRKGSGIDGLIAGYVMLEPEKGWQYLYSFFDDTQKPFLMRYAALRTVRFLWDQRPDLVPKTTLVKGVVSLLSHPDMADFAIEDLRKWQRWELTGQVLGLFNQKSHSTPIVQKAILRFALQAPEPAAAQFVRAQRQRDAEWVNDTEELLKLETTPVPAGTK